MTDEDHRLAHQLFPNWEVGAVAQTQHVLSYAGQQITGELIVDPRFVYVVGNSHLTDWQTWEERAPPPPTEPRSSSS